MLSGSPGTIAVTGKWSAALALHYSCIIAACPYVLQVLSMSPARTSCRLMMTLTSGVLETCACALGTCESRCTGKHAGLFSYACGPWPTESPRTRGSPKPSPQGGWIWSRRTHGASESSQRVQSYGTHDSLGAHLSWEANPRAAGHVAALEPTLAGRRVPEQMNMW
jgi:hypothetical protein